MHPTAAKVQARLHERGRDVEVRELPAVQVRELSV
jgi:hypothetical protein